MFGSFRSCLSCAATLKGQNTLELKSNDNTLVFSVWSIVIFNQGDPERKQRVLSMVEQMEAEGFGSCRNYGECEAQCPKEISIKFIGMLNREYLQASLLDEANPRGKMAPQ